jgi:DNA-binding CsgD family transcriptional regulator
MEEKGVKKDESVLAAGGLSALTPREHEIFNMLLEGTIPKEIVHSLNISYNTFKTHQKNLYRKLGVNTVKELVSNYNPEAGASKPAVFARWVTNYDNLGSYVNITEKIEQIEEQYFTTITIAGKLSYANHAFAGAHAYPDPSTLESMKKMQRFSFKVLGDGNVYAVMIPTTETRLKSGYNHYRKAFTTKNSEVQKVTVNTDELVQSPFWGNSVPFCRNNIEFFQLHAHSTIEFNLKIWDVRFFS